MAKYVVNGKTLTEAEYQKWSAERTRFLKDMDAGLDAMLTEGKAPSGMTDREFFLGRWENNHIAPQDYKKLLANAKKAGISTEGKRYMAGLVRKGMMPGSDPEAWVSGRGDVQKVCEERGWGAEGEVTVKGHEVEPTVPIKIPLAEDIVDGLIEEKVRFDPGLKRKKRQELKEMVIDQHGR